MLTSSVTAVKQCSWLSPQDKLMTDTMRAKIICICELFWFRDAEKTHSYEFFSFSDAHKTEKMCNIYRGKTSERKVC